MTATDRLTEAEQQTLLAVWRLGPDAFGAKIRDELAECTGRRLSISAIYVVLVRLEDRGFLSSHRTAPQPVRGGKSKRLFKMERRGVSALKQARTELDRLWNGLPSSPEWEET